MIVGGDLGASVQRWRRVDDTANRYEKNIRRSQQYRGAYNEMRGRGFTENESNLASYRAQVPRSVYMGSSNG